MNIILFDGGKITKPGIYSGVPIETYHGDICEGPSISSSGLRTIETKSPAHYWCTSALNPERVPQEPNEAFDLGKAAHTLLLSEGGFAEQFVVSPYDDFRTKAAQQWRDEVRSFGRVVITEKMLDQIRGMAKSLSQTPEIAAGLFDGLVEHSIFWQDTRTGIWLKSRPDVIPRADAVLVDLKTTTDASPRAVDRTVADYRYDVQGWLAAEGMRQVAGITVTEFLLVFVEKTPPYAVTITMVDPGFMELAGRHTRRALDTFAACLKSGEWPSYGPLRTTYAPDWMVKHAETETRYGTLPLEAT